MGHILNFTVQSLPVHLEVSGEERQRVLCAPNGQRGVYRVRRQARFHVVVVM